MAQRAQHTGRGVVVRTAMTSLLVAGLVAAPPAVAAKPRPADLVVTTVAVPSGTVTAGRTLLVTDQTRNKGGRAVRPTHTAYLLSTNKKVDRADTPLGQRKVGRLSPGRRTAGRAKVKVPATTAPGSYFVLACADHRAKVRERNEKNNCRASRTRVRVTAPAPTPPDPGATFPRTPKPLDVQYTLEPPLNAETRERFLLNFDPIVATGADGTRYELVVPPGALQSSVDLTMTPVASITGAPLTGPTRAVELKPHGVAFLEPVTLRIVPPAGTDLARASAFKLDQDGRDFHAYPAAYGDGSVTLTLFSFSSAGIGTPSGDAVTPGAGRWPRRTSAQLQQAAAELVNQERQERAGSGSDLESDMSELLGEYEREVVVPLLQQGLRCGSWAQARQGSVEAYAVSRMGQLLAGTDPISASTWDLMREVWEAQTDCLVRECTENHRVGAVLELLGLERYYQLGLGERESPILDQIDQCLRFDVEVTSSYDKEQSFQDGSSAGDGGVHYYTFVETGRWRGHATIPLTFGMLSGLTGQGPTGLDAFTYSMSRHDAQGQITDATSTAKDWAAGVASASVTMDLNSYLPVWADDWVAPDSVSRHTVSLTMEGDHHAAIGTGVPGTMQPLTERYDYIDNGVRSVRTRSEWVGATVHALADLRPGYPGADLTFASAEQRGEVFFSKTLIKQVDCTGVADQKCARDYRLSVRLVHTPQP